MATTQQYSLRVLVVDDNHDAADTLALILSMQGFDVRSAYDGVEALEVFRQFDAQAVLLDLNMPRMNGFETAAEMRLMPAPPVLIAISADNSPDSRERTKQLGFIAHLVKPADIIDVLKALDP